MGNNNAVAGSVGPQKEILFDDISPEQIRVKTTCLQPIICFANIYLKQENNEETSIFNCNWCTDINMIDFESKLRLAKSKKQKLQFVKLIKTTPGKYWDSTENFYELEVSDTSEPEITNSAVNSSSRSTKTQNAKTTNKEDGQEKSAR